MKKMESFMLKLAPKIIAFMRGRYGQNDLINKCLFKTGVIFLLLGLFIYPRVMQLIGLFLIILNLYRFLSKRIYARSNENQKFLKMTAPLRKKMNFYWNAFKNRKTHKYFHCKNCHQSMRVPKGRGTLKVTCKNCHETFTVKS